MSLSCPFSRQMKVNSNEQVDDAERTLSGRKMMERCVQRIYQARLRWSDLAGVGLFYRGCG
ncbi:hypothetical protein CTV95_10955 [Pectobacterium brasiliense]|nr:hypothetical protein CTV95_10955 [Pectobacterium brasiliense]